MTLVIPKYIEQSGVVHAQVTHIWNKDSYNDIVLKPNFPLRKKIHDISFRSEIALALGYAEWTAWRLSKDKNHILFQYIEALWVGIVDFRYLKEALYIEEADKQDIVLRPLLETYEMLIQISNLILKRKEFAHDEIVCISRISEHVLPNIKILKKWQKDTIERMCKYHRLDAHDVLGKPLPREIIDPDYQYLPENEPKLIDAFLQSVDPETNHFLKTTEELKVLGFEGEPYRYIV